MGKRVGKGHEGVCRAAAGEMTKSGFPKIFRHTQALGGQSRYVKPSEDWYKCLARA